MNICLIGVDGAGKTTHGRNIQQYLKSKGIQVKYFHSGRFRYSLLIPLLLPYYNLRRWDVVCDRSYYDYIAEFIPVSLLKHEGVSALLINIILAALPGFEITFFLKASFDTVSQRKGELTADQYKRKMRIYKIIAQSLKCVSIDTDDELDMVRRRILLCVEEVRSRHSE
ncbi:MAG: hypothetical protein HY687_05175 [Chloroflexi bacterium]|nr:hypothetical protein [Chloroflexota bacterium]